MTLQRLKVPALPQHAPLALLGLNDALAGVVLGWALATVTAVAAGAVNVLARRREAKDRREAAARLILEEIKVTQRALSDGDTRLIVAAASLPTDVWNQRREQLLGADEWSLIADAYAAIDEVNWRRSAQAIWRTEATTSALAEAREAARPQIDAAIAALERLVA